MDSDEVGPDKDAPSLPGQQTPGKSDGGDGKGEESKQTAAVLPPLPPGVQAPSLSLAVATQILQQPGGFYALPVEVQRQLVEGLNQSDRYSHEQACKTIESGERIHKIELADDKVKRWQLLLVFGIIAGLGTALAMHEPAIAKEIYSNGIQIIVALLGGIGLAKSGIFNKRKRDDDD